MLRKLDKVNITSTAKHFDSFDFSTLYTNIPHNSLKFNLRELIKEAYRIRGARYLTVNRFGVAYWSQTHSLSSH